MPNGIVRRSLPPQAVRHNGEVDIRLDADWIPKSGEEWDPGVLQCGLVSQRNPKRSSVKMVHISQGFPAISAFSKAVSFKSAEPLRKIVLRWRWPGSAYTAHIRSVVAAYCRRSRAAVRIQATRFCENDSPTTQSPSVNWLTTRFALLNPLARRMRLLLECGGWRRISRNSNSWALALV